MVILILFLLNGSVVTTEENIDRKVFLNSKNSTNAKILTKETETKVNTLNSFLTVTLNDTNKGTNKEKNINKENLYGRKECVHLPKFQPEWIEMLVSCPDNYGNLLINYWCSTALKNATNAHQIQDGDSSSLHMQRLPVQDDRGTVYGNIYCAVCNHVTSVRIWDVVIHCDRASHLKFVEGGRIFHLFHSLPPGKCYTSLIPANPSGLRRCHPKRTARKVERSRPEYDAEYFESPVKYPISFTVLMNFGFDGKTHVLFSNTHVKLTHLIKKKCPSYKEIFVSNSNRCYKVHCAAGYLLTKLGCVARDNSKSYLHQGKGKWDSQTLTSLNQVAKVSLEMNVTYGDLPFMIPEVFRRALSAEISRLLNISSDRIKNLTVVLLNESTSGERLRVDPLPENYFENVHSKRKPRVERVTVPSSKFTTQNSPPEIRRVNRMMNHSELNLKSKRKKLVESLSKTILKITNDNDRLKTNKFKNEYSGKKTASRGKLTVPYSDKSKIINRKDRGVNPSVSIRVSFLLFPSRNRSESDTSVSSVVHRMKEVIAEKKFILIVNKTVVQILDKNKESDQWLGTDFCNSGISEIVYSDEFELLLPGKDRNGTQIYVNRTRTTFYPGQFQLSVIVQGNSDVTNYDGFAIVCSMPHIADDVCTRLEVPKTDYTLLANRSVTVSGKLYNTSQYSYVNDDLTTIEICIPEELSHPAKQQTKFTVVPGCDKGYEGFLKADSLLTAVLSRVSVLALAIVFVTYLLLPHLRNLAGVNIMNLTFALLVAETIFTVGENTEVTWACSAVAVSLHYFFLASFFWMNIMTYDVYCTFSRNLFSVGIRAKEKYTWRYALYGWGMPLFIVATCVFIDYSQLVSGTRIGYGRINSLPPSQSVSSLSSNATNRSLDNAAYKSQGCWIKSPVAALAVFGAPMLAVFVINGFLFIKTILNIQQTAKLAHLKTRRSSVNHVTGRYEVMLYLRMSTVMGFTWIFGLASSLVSVITTTPSSAICYSVHMLAILFTISNCSQGLFIFFAFIVKRRVLFMYRSLWHRLRFYFISSVLNNSPPTNKTLSISLDSRTH